MSESETPTWPRLAGALLQGLLLGISLFFAIVKLLELSSNARLFRYEGF